MIVSFRPGRETYFASDSPCAQYSVFFEDDGESGYFYAWQQAEDGGGMILDAVQIYGDLSVADTERESSAQISWSIDGKKALLSINGYSHAAFDFEARRGYCRTDFPNFPSESTNGWRTESHAWDERVMDLFR